MSTEAIYKLEPHRTLYLRGFDRRGAAASLHNASASGFTLSGAWSDPADFAVLVLHDADDNFGHLTTTKYLPDFSLAGVTLDFDLAVTGCQNPVSGKYASVPWDSISFITSAEQPSGTTGLPNVSLKGCAISATGMAAASCTYTVGGTPVHNDRVQLVYLGNVVFDYTQPYTAGGTINAGGQFAVFTTHGAGYTHFIQIAGVKYSYVESASDTPDSIRDALISAVNAGPDPFAHASAGTGYVYTGITYSVVMLTAYQTLACSVPCAASDNIMGSIQQFSGGSVLEANTQEIAQLLNQHNWAFENVSVALMVSSMPSSTSFVVQAARLGAVSVSGTSVTWVSGQNFLGLKAGDAIILNGVPYTVASVTSPTALTLTTTAGTLTSVTYLAPGGGRDGNAIELLSMQKTTTLYLLPSAPIVTGGTLQKMTGGTDPTSVHYQVDFTAKGIDSVRQLWLTFAPPLNYDSGTANPTLVPFSPLTWNVVFSNWTLTDPSGHLPLKIAGPGSVTLGSRDSMVSYSGTNWTEQSGFYYKGFARATAHGTDAVTIKYTCQYTHDLYLGTSLMTSGGKFTSTVDGVAKNTVDTYADTGEPVQTRRLVATSIPAGSHTVVLTLSATANPLSTGTNGFFDYLQAAVRSDVQDPVATYSGANCACDFDTNQTYALAPARVLWLLKRAGFTGDIDFYSGVFFALKRTRYGGYTHSATVTISVGSGGFNPITSTVDGDAAFLQVGGAAYGDGLGTAFGVGIYPMDTVDTVALRFVNAINGLFVGIWASYTGAGQLTISTLSPVQGFTLFSSFHNGAGYGTPSGGSITIAGDIGTGNEGVWQVDATQSQPLNQGFVDYLTDFCNLVHAAGQSMTVAYSQELLAPPDSNDAAPTTVTFGFWNYLGTGFNHTITIGSKTYSHIQLSTDGSGDIATALAAAINAGAGDQMAVATASGNNVTLSPRCGGSTVCSAAPDGNGPGTLKSGAWSQRFADGTAVLTSTGFGSWGAGVVKFNGSLGITQPGHGYITGNTVHIASATQKGVWSITVTDADHYQLTTLLSGGYTPGVGDTTYIDLQTAQCTFNPATVTPYLASVYKQTAGIMNTAGLTPWLQFGEVLWWFFSRYMSETIGWASYTSPISIGTNAAHNFTSGQRVIVAGVGGNTAANGDQTITVTDSTHFTENGSSGNGNYIGGTGTVSGGGMAYYDANTSAAALTALGRALATFYHQDEDPTVNGGADVSFLAGRLKAHIDSIRTTVLGSYSNTKFELLWPYDVNFGTCYYTAAVPYPQGGRLNRAVNFPTQYQSQAGSGLDRLKIEALSWGATYRNGANAQASIQFPFTSPCNWPTSKTAYLVPWFNGGCPWPSEYLTARYLPLVNFWAFDHLVLLSWPLPLPVPAGTIFIGAPGA